MNYGSFKDFEKVFLKANNQIQIGERTINPGEIITFFDKIQIAGLQEFSSTVAATGGFDNRPLVTWETTKGLQLSFTQGVFSKEEFALLTNSKMFVLDDTIIPICQREFLESDENGQITCKFTPARGVSVYRESDFQKLDFTQSENTLTISEPYTNVIVDYEFDYNETNGKLLKIGQRLLKGSISLEARTRIKDDKTGQIITGLMKIPNLRLTSDLSLRLGESASPVSAAFQAEAIPVGSRSNSKVMDFLYLGSDLEADL